MADSGVVVRFGRRLNFMESGYAADVAEAGDRRADHRLPCFAGCLCGADIYSTKWLGTFAGKADMEYCAGSLRHRVLGHNAFSSAIRCQAGKEIKMAESAPVEDKDDSVQP